MNATPIGMPPVDFGMHFACRELQSLAAPYLVKNPTATKALQLIRDKAGDTIAYDHFAFRTFGIDGCGIDSIAKKFVDFGYRRRDELRFPAKKLRAFWFSPPARMNAGVHARLPRIFISEILVSQLSSEAQDTIRKYTNSVESGDAVLSSIESTTLWPTPSFGDFQQLAEESEYAAWTLINGYALNHLTVSVHSLQHVELQNINMLNKFLQKNGIKLNSEGGVLKVSPDGGLLQSSTVADLIPFKFSDGITREVPASYIEFAQRLVLPQFKNIPADEIEECHRREGFEVGNADKIFESTSSSQMK